MLAIADAPTRSSAEQLAELPNRLRMAAPACADD